MLRSRNDSEKEQRQQQILAAAVGEFTRCGYAGATMTGIAKASGLSRTLVNFYFKDKAGVHAAIEDLALRCLAQEFQQAADTQIKAIDKLMALAKAYIEFQNQHPGYFEALSRKDDQHATHALTAPTTKLSQILYTVFELGEKDKTLSHNFNNNVQAALVFWASVYGSISIAENMPGAIQTHFNSSAEELFQGLEIMLLKVFGAQ